MYDSLTVAHTPKPQPSFSRAAVPFYHIVEGHGWFPEDMLRYDHAWAVTGMNMGGSQAVHTLHSAQRRHRSVVVASWMYELTADRWASFGWGVTSPAGGVDRPPFLPKDA